jgi:hypothetical protein
VIENELKLQRNSVKVLLWNFLLFKMQQIHAILGCGRAMLFGAFPKCFC